MPVPTNQSQDDVVMHQVLQRAATDKAFRTRLLEQPDSALEEVIGVSLSTLPKAYKVRFIEKDASVDALLVLPDYQDAEGTLSDAELEAVAGGDWCFTSCGWTITVCDYTKNNEVTICKA